MYYGNGLCESVTANDDASEFTLKLKDGLKWHDGQPVTAKDWVFTAQLITNPKFDYGLRSEFNTWAWNR